MCRLETVTYKMIYTLVCNTYIEKLIPELLEQN